MKQRVKHIILLILAMWVTILPSIAAVSFTSTNRYCLRDYCGNYIYQNGNISMITTPAGYISGSMRYYYLKDYQGNNCVVLNQNGVVQQINHYYPYGSLMGEGFNASSQPYRYGGKELVTLGGLNLSDFGARWLDSPSGTFTTMDPLCEDFQHLSPYLYCAGNPIKYIDPSGMYFGKASMDEAIQILRDLSYELTNIRNNKSISEEETNSRATEIIQSMLDIVFMMYDKTKEYEYSYENDKNGIIISRKNTLGHDVITMYVEKDEKGIKVHESRHGGQVARGELNLGTTSGEFNYNINHEISAYKAQFSVDGVILYNIKYTSNGIDNLFPQKIRTIKDIDEKFIKSIHEEISNGVIVPLYNF